MTPPATRMSAQERRADVLRAAVDAFATGGFAGTSTDAIAHRAGISQPYLFRLFPTKKALFLAVLEHCWATVLTAFETAAGDRTGEAAFEEMGEAYGRLLEDRHWLLVQMQGYAACDDPDIRAAMRRGFRTLWDLIARVTGADPIRIREFVAMGMLLNVAAAMDLPALDERWAQLCTEQFE